MIMYQKDVGCRSLKCSDVNKTSEIDVRTLLPRSVLERAYRHIPKTQRDSRGQQGNGSCDTKLADCC